MLVAERSALQSFTEALKQHTVLSLVAGTVALLLLALLLYGIKTHRLHPRLMHDVESHS